MPEFQPNTNATFCPANPTPLAVRVPEIVNDAPCNGLDGTAETMSEVERGLGRMIIVDDLVVVAVVVVAEEVVAEEIVAVVDDI